MAALSKVVAGSRLYRNEPARWMPSARRAATILRSGLPSCPATNRPPQAALDRPKIKKTLFGGGSQIRFWTRQIQVTRSFKGLFTFFEADLPPKDSYLLVKA